MKILVSIISSKLHIDERIFFIKKTWLRDVPKYVIISDYEDQSDNTVKLSEDTSYNSNVEKNFKSFKLFSEKYKEFDWFINVDDDTYLNYENLRNLVSGLSTDEVYITGFINEGTYPEDTSLHYCSGGAGYLFNRKTLNVLKEISEDCNISRFADVNIGVFCRNNSINIIHNNLFNKNRADLNVHSLEHIKKSITFHYVFGESFDYIYSLINK